MFMISRVKGTQDFLDLSLWQALIERTKKHLELYAFLPIATPLIEYTSLFERSLGEHTDVISKEMFLIKGKNDEADGLICLRPEATASTVRAFVENGIQATPWKVFTWGPMFRYERPQKGRFRQFHQISIEVIGSSAPEQDVECIVMLDRLFHEQFKLDSYALLVNYLGCAQDRAEHKKELIAFLEKHVDELCDFCKERMHKNPLRVFDCKTPSCQKLYEKAPMITDYLCSACKAEWQQVQQGLALMGVTYSHKPTLVRGLDYYNKTVFEFVSANLGAQSAFCGGGRYDQLVSQIGGKQDQPSIGAAIGIERLMLLLEPIKDRLGLPTPPALHMIMPMQPEQQPMALLLADHLRAHGLCADICLDESSIKGMMKQANRAKAAYALIIGSDEQASHTVMVKNMLTGVQEKIAQVKIVEYLKNNR